VRVAYLQDERQFARVSPEELSFVLPEENLPFTLLVGNPHKQVARRQKTSPNSDGSVSTVIVILIPSRKIGLNVAAMVFTVFAHLYFPGL